VGRKRSKYFIKTNKRHITSRGITEGEEIGFRTWVRSGKKIEGPFTYWGLGWNGLKLLFGGYRRKTKGKKKDIAAGGGSEMRGEMRSNRKGSRTKTEG